MKQSQYNIWVDRDDRAYVFNGVTGALLSMPASDRATLQRVLAGETGFTCSTELLKQLALGKMLLPDGEDELGLLSTRYEATRHDTSHFALTIVTSLGCNFDCPYCFEAKHPSILSAEVEQALLEVVDDQLPKIQSLRVTW